MADPSPPAAFSDPNLLVLVLPSGSRVPVNGPMTVGRGEEASVRIANRTVSRMHAKISVGPEGPLIEDAGSLSGTLLSGERLTGPAPLRPGAQVRLGEVAIRVESVAPASGGALVGELGLARRS